MSFWKTFGFHTVSAIDTLIESGDFTLEQLLDEEEILQETKSQNKKLLDFLTEPETLKKLLTYITVEPKEEDDAKRKFKYPFLACEILASEVWAICDAMYQDHSLLDVLYGYFERDPPLNPLLSSYSSRVAGILLQKKVAETIDYMKARRDIIGQFLKHLGNASVMDLLLKVIQCEDTNEGSGTLEWLCSTDLIHALVAKFDPINSAEVHENAAQALVDIILVSMNSSSSPLIAQLESQEVLEKLFHHILTEQLSSGLLHGLTVVIELLRRHVNEQHDQRKLEELPPLFKLLVAHLSKFHSYLSMKTRTNNKLTVTMPLPSGEFEPLGFYRLKVIEFFAILIITNYAAIDAEIIKLNVLSTCLNLFFQYPWNNFLHSTVEQVIQTILDGENEELKIHLLRDANLLDKICDASKENEDEIAKPKGVRRGYMGHLTSISTSIINIASSTPSVEKLLTTNEKWAAYVKGALASTREKESKSLAYMPSDFAVDEGEEVDDYDDNGEDYSPEEHDQFRLEQDDDDDDDDDEEEEGVVIQSRRVDDGDEDTIEQEVWEEKEIQDREEDTTQHSGEPSSQPPQESTSSPAEGEQTSDSSNATSEANV